MRPYPKEEVTETARPYIEKALLLSQLYKELIKELA
jgi:hypothetical protein